VEERFDVVEGYTGIILQEGLLRAEAHIWAIQNGCRVMKVHEDECIVWVEVLHVQKAYSGVYNSFTREARGV